MHAAHEDDDDRDDPQDLDLDWSDEQDKEEDTIECPECGRVLHWAAPRCPGCGMWIEGGDSLAARRSRGWFWPLIVALLIAVILVMWHGFRF